MGEVVGKPNFARRLGPKRGVRVDARLRRSGCPLIGRDVVLVEGNVAVLRATVAGPALVKEPPTVFASSS